MADNTEILETPAAPEPAAAPVPSSYRVWKEQRTRGEQPSEAPEAESAPDPDAGEANQGEAESVLTDSDEPAKPESPKKGKRSLVEEAVHWRKKYREVEPQITRITELSSENLRLKQQLESLQRTPQTPTPDKQEAPKATDSLPQRPRLENFSTIEEWQAADETWLDQRDEYKERAREMKTRQQQQAEQARRMTENWNKVSQKAERDFPGFNDSVNQAVERGYASPLLGQVILQHALDNPDAAIAVTRYLTSKPEESQRISGYHDNRTVLEVGRLIERFVNPALVKTTPGPSETTKPAVPATTVLNGSGNAPHRLEDAKSFREWKSLKNRGAAKR